MQSWRVFFPENGKVLLEETDLLSRPVVLEPVGQRLQTNTQERTLTPQPQNQDNKNYKSCQIAPHSGKWQDGVLPEAVFLVQEPILGKAIQRKRVQNSDMEALKVIFCFISSSSC